MYFIWILIGIPIASLLCTALVVIRDGKVRSSNEAVSRTGSAFSITALSKIDKVDDLNSENTVQVLIGILNNPNSDGFRVTIRQAAAQKVVNGNTGTTFLLGSEGLTVIGRTSVETDYKVHLMQQSSQLPR